MTSEGNPERLNKPFSSVVVIATKCSSKDAEPGILEISDGEIKYRDKSIFAAADELSTNCKTPSTEILSPLRSRFNESGYHDRFSTSTKDILGHASKGIQPMSRFPWF